MLTVAAPIWQAALRSAFVTAGKPTLIDVQTAADAVITLATNPTAYDTLALEISACGAWFDTLVDLTLGDTQRSISLLILGSQPSAGARLEGAARLAWPVDQINLCNALNQAKRNIAKNKTPSPPEVFSKPDSIRVRYQPVVRLRDRYPTTVEVLARIARNDGAIIGPEVIIAAMISGEHSLWLSSFIMQLALRERSDGAFEKFDTRFAFNLPLDALLHPNLPTLLETIRAAAELPANVMSFELTETQPVNNLPALLAVMLKLRQSGFRLALDDITPQTSNLENLLALPFRCVKLDRSVVINAQNNDPAISQPARDFIAMITANARKTYRAVVAEGIESQQTVQTLYDLGVTHGQGFYFARPLPARALKAWLTHWNRTVGKARP